MTATHKELKSLVRFRILDDSGAENSLVLELTTNDEEFHCVVSREMFLRLSETIHKRARALKNQ